MPKRKSVIIKISLDIKNLCKSVIICGQKKRSLWTKNSVDKNKSVDKMRLSKNFTMEELCRSATAERHGIRNWPKAGDEEHRVRENLRYLCFDVLQPLREHVGKPIVVNSGYRSKEVNRLVGGVKNSQHLTGEAADLRIESTKQGREWAEWIMENCDFDQMLLERNGKSVWLHVSAKRDKSLNRRVFKKMKV